MRHFRYLLCFLYIIIICQCSYIPEEIIDNETFDISIFEKLNEYAQYDSIILKDFCAGSNAVTCIFSNDSIVSIPRNYTEIFEVCENGTWSLNGNSLGIVRDNTISDFNVLSNGNWGYCGIDLGVTAKYNHTSTPVSHIVIDDFSLYIVINKNECLHWPLPISQSFNPIEVSFEKTSQFSANQGLAIVGNSIIHLFSAKDDHTDYNLSIILNYPSFDLRGYVYHNLGHVASADYSTSSDCLLLGNGTTNKTVLPRIDLVLNANAHISHLDSLHFNGDDIISIELYDKDKQIGGNGCVACFGESDDVVFIATTDNPDSPSGRKFFKCQLGKGSNDLTHCIDYPESSLFGHYIEGKKSTEYNGTLKVIDSYSGLVDTEVYQGIDYYDGCIYLACGYTKQLIHKIRLTPEGQYKILKTVSPCKYDINDNINIEPEGLAIVDNESILLGNAGVGLYKLSIF